MDCVGVSFDEFKIEREDCAPCAGGFPERKKFDDDELDDDSGLEAAGMSSLSFCIFRRVDLYASRIPDMSAKGSSSILLEMVLRREWFNPRRLI